MTISERNLPDAAAAPPAQRVLALGSSTVDLARQVVSRDGHEIRLRPRTADVLTHLVAHAGAIVTKQSIIDAVWGGVAVTDDSLVQCLVEIRRALGPDQQLVRTVRGRGYLLDGEVAPTGPAAVGTSPPAAAPEKLAPQESAVVVPLVTTGSRRSWVFAGVTVTAVLSVLAAVSALSPRVERPAAIDLPDTMVPEARSELDAGLALLRVSRAQTDLQRARQYFERAVALDPGYAAAHAALGNVLVLTSAFGLQPPLEVLPAAGVAARRAVALDPTLAAGWQALAHVQTQADWDWVGAERSYRRAMALDPSAQFNVVFAHLLAGVGRSAEAIAESDRLVAIDPTSALRLGSNCIVNYFARRYEAAVAACDRSLAIDPNYSTSHLWRALALSVLGRHDDAMAAALASRRGMGFGSTWVVGYVHARAGRLDEAREVLRAMQAKAATAYVPPVEIAFLLAAIGHPAEALDWLERGHRQGGPWLELLAVHAAADPLRSEPRFKHLLRAMRLPDQS